jgi:hypothetical protein
MRILSALLCVLVLAILACGGEPTYTSTKKKKSSKPQGYTGLLLNFQRPPTEVPLKKTLNKWKVVDSSGDVIFSKDDIPASSKQEVWEWRRSEAVKKRFWLGDNPYEVRMTKDEYGEGYKEGTFYVSDATAADLRNMPNLQKLLRMANVVVLVGKEGQ